MLRTAFFLAFFWASRLGAAAAAAPPASCSEGGDGLASCSATDGPRAGHALLQTQSADRRHQDAKAKHASMPFVGRLHMIDTEVNELKSRVSTLQAEVGMDEVPQADFATLEEQLSSNAASANAGAKQASQPTVAPQELKQDFPDELQASEDWAKDIAPMATEAAGGPEQSKLTEEESLWSSEPQEEEGAAVPAKETQESDGEPAAAAMALEEEAAATPARERRKVGKQRHRATAKEGHRDAVEEDARESPQATAAHTKVKKHRKSKRKHRRRRPAAGLLALAAFRSSGKPGDSSLRSTTAALESEVATLKSKVQGLENQVGPGLRHGPALLAAGSRTVSKASLHARIVTLEREVEDLRSRVSSLEHRVVG